MGPELADQINEYPKGLRRPDGSINPIQQVQVGELVISRYPATGNNEAKRVTQTYTRLAPQVLTLTFADPQTGQSVESVTCTPGHPFYVLGKGFVPAGQLGIGTQIVTRAGPAVTAAGIVWHKNADGSPQGAEVYNFTVADDHTYFVGAAEGGVWVHNDSIFAANLQPGPDGGVNPGQPLTFGQALDRIRRGQDVMADCRSTAKNLASRPTLCK